MDYPTLDLAKESVPYPPSNREALRYFQNWCEDTMIAHGLVDSFTDIFAPTSRYFFPYGFTPGFSISFLVQLSFAPGNSLPLEVKNLGKK